MILAGAFFPAKVLLTKDSHHEGWSLGVPFLGWGRLVLPLSSWLPPVYDFPMPDPIDRKDFQNLCDMTIDSMYELAALGELLEQKGLLTKQEILTLAQQLKQKADSANSTDPSSKRFTAQENAVIEELMEVILKHGLSADHAKELLGRTIQLLEWGKQTANKMPEANA